MVTDEETGLTASNDIVARALREVADGLSAGALRVGEDDDAVEVTVPDELTLAIELETGDADVNLELEVEWPRSAERAEPRGDRAVVPVGEDAVDETDDGDERAGEDGEDAVVPGGEGVAGADDAAALSVDDAPEVGSVPPLAVDTPEPVESLARFQVFRDRADEWRWRLVHRNGNIIATSGEGYTRKHNAQKGLRSVVRNAPDAEVVEDTDG